MYSTIDTQPYKIYATNTYMTYLTRRAVQRTSHGLNVAQCGVFNSFRSWGSSCSSQVESASQAADCLEHAGCCRIHVRSAVAEQAWDISSSLGTLTAWLHPSCHGKKLAAQPSEQWNSLLFQSLPLRLLLPRGFSSSAAF